MDMYDTGVLVRVVAGLHREPMFFLDRFFREEDTQESLNIHFDLDDGRPTIAPYVSPMVKGQIMTDEGYQTKTFRPAYVKPKNVVRPSAGFRRVVGEKIGGSLSPQQRIDANLKRLLGKQIKGIDVRCHLQAVEALRTGKITVTGDNYPTVVVDFGRDAALTVDISGGAAEWGDEGVSPLANIDTWASLVLTKSGATVTDVVMDPKAWALFAASEDVKTRLDTRRADGGGPLKLQSPPIEGGRYMGTMDGYDFWQFAGSYKDVDGTEKQILPDYTVIMSGPQLEGVRTYAAIQDERAGLRAMAYFPKSWLEEDPAARMLMTQSAPLMVPYRPNASLCATVKAA